MTFILTIYFRRVCHCHGLVRGPKPGRDGQLMRLLNAFLLVLALMGTNLYASTALSATKCIDLKY